MKTTFKAVFAALVAAPVAPPAMATVVPPPLHRTVACDPLDEYSNDGQQCFSDFDGAAAYANAYSEDGKPPFVAAEANRGGGPALGSASALATITYSLVLKANDPNLVELRKLSDIKALYVLQQDTPGPYLGASAFASITISGPQGILVGGYEAICTLGCAGSGGDAKEAAGALDMQVFTNTIYTVSLVAAASVAQSPVPIFAKALADPYFYIDPGSPDAGKYSFVFSAGVGNNPPGETAVPEPNNWAMMVGGFTLLGGAMRRRRGAARA